MGACISNGRVNKTSMSIPDLNSWGEEKSGKEEPVLV